MKLFSKVISIVFHPLFISAYFLLFLYWLNASFLDFKDRNNTGLIIISILSSTILFPAIALFLMKGLNLIESIEMKDKKERVGPLIVTSLFYIWMYLNFKRNNIVPEYLTFFILGTTIALFFGFFTTLFYKVSLHAIGISGLITGLYLIRVKYHFDDLVLSMVHRNWILQSDLLFVFLVVIAGLVGTARLYLKDHSNKQVYLGYGLGVTSMLFAFFLFY